MKKNSSTMSRRNFLAVSGAMAGTTIMDPKSNIFANTATVSKNNTKKMKNDYPQLFLKNLTGKSYK